MERPTELAALFLALALAGALLRAGDCEAAEGGYSNYVPGTYGDFGMALAPAETWTMRNDVYYYDASVDRSVRSGNLEVGVDLELLLNFTTLLYKPDIQIFGAQIATGIFVPIVANADIGASVSVGGAMVSASDDTSGLGDIALIPLALYWNSGNLHASFAEFIVTPKRKPSISTSLPLSLPKKSGGQLPASYRERGPFGRSSLRYRLTIFC